MRRFFFNDNGLFKITCAKNMYRVGIENTIKRGSDIGLGKMPNKGNNMDNKTTTDIAPGIFRLLSIIILGSCSI